MCSSCGGSSGSAKKVNPMRGKTQTGKGVSSPKSPRRPKSVLTRRGSNYRR